ncbi:ATP-binding protein [Elioraea sp.]|uniref:ATP-binding protein n=1 Tax=Elioraea sp. TaxID=2185103 RepID=UPI0025BFC417|nr:ATP-binding protein [Elioraea sp.]
MRVWPRSIAGRTFLVLLLGLFAVQVVALTIHAFDRIEIQRAQQAREAVGRTAALWRTLVMSQPERRDAIARGFDLPEGVTATVDAAPLAPERGLITDPGIDRIAAGLSRLGPLHMRPREVLVGGVPRRAITVSLRLPEGAWLNVNARPPPPRPWSAPGFLAALGLMTVAVAALSFWAVRRTTRPISDLAAAAERLGRDVNAPRLPETGPAEVAQAAAAFNTMADRIGRFVADRTAMLAAVGHDLRTPITRLRLRAEFVEDDVQRAKILADLDEMEAMIAGTLAFARDEAATQPMGRVDLAELLRTIADEANDVAGHEVVTLAVPPHLPVDARPLALKRALGNLVRNAVVYGGGCRVTLSGPEQGIVRIAVADEGPGIPEAELERVFQPFHRLEASRNRETGGTGLGLSIARNILRAHGGDVTLANRSPAGVMATATLPA